MSNRLKKLQKLLEEQKREDKIAVSLKQAKSQARSIELMCSSVVEKERPILNELLTKVYEVVPKLVCREYLEGFKLLVKLSPWLRSIKDWRPRGKGSDTIFQSLVDHLIVKYPTPKFLYKVFLKRRINDNHGLLFKYVAQGGSLAKAGDLMPVPLTKKMRADFVQLPAETKGLVEGIRTVQVKAFKGTPEILNAVLASNMGDSFRGNEEFWMTVIQWFCNNPMLDKKHVGPLIDYINHCRAQDENFVMKGRSPLAMIRGMEEWHGTLARIRAMKGLEFKPCGLEGGDFVTKELLFGQKIERHWKIIEILGSKELAEEGRALKHCVYSYAHSIADGRTSIWSLRESGIRMVTIEVNNQRNAVTQVRGKCNRFPDSQEKSVIRRWCNNNSLLIQCWGF